MGSDPGVIVEMVGAGSLTSRAKSAILESVLAGRFQGGRLPPEPELARMLGVSRTTARAALQRFEQHGSWSVLQVEEPRFVHKACAQWSRFKI